MSEEQKETKEETKEETMEVEVPGAEEEADEWREKLEEAHELADADPTGAMATYQSILNCSEANDRMNRTKEEALYSITKLYIKMGKFDDVMNILTSNSAFFDTIPKAKTAKIVRTVIELVSKAPNSLDVEVNLCEQVVKWCEAEKRNFLRQRIQCRLAALMFRQEKFQDAMELTTNLLRELKKLNDKQLLCDTHLTESRINHALRNMPKSKAALTAARTAANSIYVTPAQQGDLDQMSGILHLEEGDFSTAYSYFLEAFEAFDSLNDAPTAVTAMKYMMLCKVLGGDASDVQVIVSGKWGLKYNSSRDIEALTAIAKAAKDRSLAVFTKAVEEDYGAELEKDGVMKHQLNSLYDSMVKQNLLKILEPYSRVEIGRVQELIGLPLPVVEKKLGQMILDQAFYGTLDQGSGHVIIYREAEKDTVYGSGLKVISNLDEVVGTLYRRAQGLVQHG